MVSIRLTASGFKSNKNILDTITDTIKEDTQRLLHRLGEDIVDQARYNLAQNDNIDTGGLRGSIKILSEDDTSITVGTDALHAIYIEFGRGPIFAKEGKWLRFFDKKSGKLIFTKNVGPVEPAPFLQPAVESVSRTFSDILVEDLTNLVRKNGGSDSEEL